jgi:hypothetical protein
MAEICIHDMPLGQCAICRPQIEDAECNGCGRPLNDPLSIKIGVGPVCFENDADARALVRALAEKGSDGTWWELSEAIGLAESSAKLWTQAIRQLDGVEASYRWDIGGYRIDVRLTPNEEEDI